MQQQLTSTQSKPVLDESSFQRLLAAAYVLQEHNDRLLAREPKSDHNQILSEIVETQKLIQSRQLDLQAAAKLIAERLQKITNATGVAIGAVKDDQLTYCAGTGSAAREAGSCLPLDSCLSAHCLRHGQVLQCSQAEKDSRLRPVLCRERGVKSLIAVPVYHEGKVAGVLELRSAKAHSFRENDLRTCQFMAGLVTEAIAKTAEVEWKQALAAERATMLEALERIKPQLERLAVAPPPATVRPPAQVEPVAPAEPAAIPANEPGEKPAEFVAMLEALEQVKPQLDRLVTEPAAVYLEALARGEPVAVPASEPASPEPIALAAMREALEKIKPRLDPLAVKPAVAPVGPMPAYPPEVKKNAGVICRGCGHHFQEEEYFCGLCGTARLGEKSSSGEVQNKWASVFNLPEAEENSDNQIPFAEAEPVTGHLGGPSAALPSTLQDIAAQFPQEEDPALEAVPHWTTESTADLATVEPVPLPVIRGLASAPPQDPPMSPWTSARKAREWLESLAAQRPDRLWWGRQWRRQRANIYVGLAALVLLVVLSGWGTRPAPDGITTASANPASANPRRRKTPPAPQLSVFEQVLVGLGLAEAPPAPAYLGNPATQVWVDVHTALYYCPGADLYGKTAGGKFTTQRDAQQDQFEPAFRKACE